MQWASSGIEAGVTGKAFATQYTALIMIILSFVLGSFARAHLPPPPQSSAPVNAVLKEAVAPHNAYIAIDQIVLPDLFIAETAAIDADALQTVLALLQNHDLNLRIEAHLMALPRVSAELSAIEVVPPLASTQEVEYQLLRATRSNSLTQLFARLAALRVSFGDYGISADSIELQINYDLGLEHDAIVTTLVHPMSEER